MAYSLPKRFRAYIAPALLTYTVLVTFLLVQTAWNDGTTVRKARAWDPPAARRYVPTKEERRHLRSLEDVDGMGNVAQDRRDRSLTNYRRERNSGLQNGRKVQSSLSNDFYVDDMDNNGTSEGNNGTHSGANLPPGGRDYILESRLYQFRPDSVGRRKFEGDGSENGIVVESPRSNEKQPQHTNVEIEEMIPDAGNKTPLTNVTKSVLKFRHHSFRDKKAGASSNADRSSSGKDSQRLGQADTQYCDNIERDGRLCYRDRVVYSHRNHVNISSTHQSFRSFGGLYIYSAFLDTRQTPAAIRVMTIGPKGYQNGGSSLWCAFSSPMAVSRRYRWTGQEDRIANGRTQATQMYFYTASDGHDRIRQFYVMSCDVPDTYLNTLVRFDGNRIDIVAGTQNSALLDTIQERIAITVINNKGLPWHILKEQASVRTPKLVPYNINSIANFQGKSEQGLNGTEKSDLRGVANWIEKSSSIAARNISQLGNGNPLPSDKSASVYETPNGTTEPKVTYVGPPGGQDAIVSCVAPVYGLNGIVQVTEFIEMTLLLGVQHIVFYTFQVSADVRQILHMYKEQGLVTVLPWNVPDSKNIWAKGRDVALNDCLYRTMFRYDFVLFHDVDEFLVPRATPDLPSLLGLLRTRGRLNTTRISDIVFNSAYFAPPTKVQATNLTAMPGYTKDVPKLITLRSLHRTYFSAHHTLRIIKPVAAMRVGAGERKRTTFYINPRFAGVNHYTKCPNASSPSAINKPGHRDNHESSKDSQNSVDCVHTKWDDGIWKYKDKLIQNTKDSIRAFNAQGGVRR